MKIKSLLTREIVSDKRSNRWASLVMFAYALLLPIPFIAKLTSLNPTASQWLFSSLLILALSLQIIVHGLLLPLVQPKGRSRFYASAGQIVIYTASALMLILGIPLLGSVVTSEYELIFGLLLLFQVMTAGMFFGAILPLLQADRADRREGQQVSR